MKVIPAGRIKYIHVNQHMIRANAKDKGNRKVITVKCGKDNFYGNDVQVEDGQFIYQAHKPILSCGARLVFKTKGEVKVL
jgi:hypothetical protein